MAPAATQCALGLGGAALRAEAGGAGTLDAAALAVGALGAAGGALDEVTAPREGTDVASLPVELSQPTVAPSTSPRLNVTEERPIDAMVPLAHARCNRRASH